MSNSVTTFISTDKEVANNESRISICLRTNGFSFSVTTIDKELLTFGEAEVDLNQPFKQLSQAIMDIFAQKGISTFGNKEARLVVCSEHFVWIPAHLYESSRDRQYLRMTSWPESHLGVYHAFSDATKSYNVFSASSDVVTAFKLAIPGIDVVSQHWVLANEELMKRSAQHPVMLMHVREGVGDFEAFYNGQLLLSNSYAAINDSELLYHSLEVMKTMHLETPDMELAICGNVGREIYSLLQHYFPNVTLFTGQQFHYSNPEFQTFHSYRHALLLS